MCGLCVACARLRGLCIYFLRALTDTVQITMILMKWGNKFRLIKHHEKYQTKGIIDIETCNGTAVLKELSSQLLNTHNNNSTDNISVLMFCRQRNLPGAAWNCCSKVRFYAAARWPSTAAPQCISGCRRTVHGATSSCRSDECGDDRRTGPQRTRSLPERHTPTEDTNWTWDVIRSEFELGAPQEEDNIFHCIVFGAGT